MRTAIGAVTLAVLIALALTGGCTTKPQVREKPQGDPLFSTRKVSEDDEKPKERPGGLTGRR